jgi:GT2 family glycosyltransferase
MNKIGVGIITCNRPEFFKKCRQSIKEEWYDCIVVVNDGEGPVFDANAPVIGTKGMEGVGRAKNLAFKHLLDEGCEYIILVEDDMVFKGNIFQEYIKAYKKTGIEHFMFAYHGPANKGMVSGGPPKPRKIIDYYSFKLALNENCVGAVCFYTRNCLEKVGLFDENYTNAFEHVDHSYKLSKEGFTTPYWWWPDLANSLDYVEEQACSEQSSAIRPRDDWQQNINESWSYFENKHGVGPTSVKDTPFQNVGEYLKIKKPKNKISFIVHFRKDTEHRMDNFNIIYSYFKDILPDCEFVFVEDDKQETIKDLIKKEDKYIFFKNEGIYNKCIGYNIGLKEASNDIVCFLDIDCLVSIDSIIKSISLAKKDMIVIGYNGTAIYVEHPLKDKAKNNKGVELFNFLTNQINRDVEINGKNHIKTGYIDRETYCIGNTSAVGGCLVGKKSTFEKINGFNPNFIGWGYEDNEIISRAGTLNVSVARVGNETPNWFLFHLPHEEGGVAIRDKDRHGYYKHNEEEVQKVESMNKEQLTEYIKSW